MNGYVATLIIGIIVGWLARTAYQALLYDAIKSLRRQMHGQSKTRRRRR